MSRQPDQSNKHHPGLPNLISGIVLLIALSSLMVVSGQKGWEKQTLLTQSFEDVWRKQPSKAHQNCTLEHKYDNQRVYKKNCNEFNQIFDTTGLTPIWNWKRLIP